MAYLSLAGCELRLGQFGGQVAGLGIDLKRIKASDETNPDAEALHAASEVGKDKK